MSPKTATKAIGLGFGVAALAALAQLGLAYGFGLLSLVDAAPGSSDPVTDTRWNANLAWVGWFAAASCVVGALASGVIGGRGAAAGPPVVRVGAVVAGAVGAFVVGPLVSVSAEQVGMFESFPVGPVYAAAIGAAVGLVLALIGLSSRSVAVNVGASAALVWLLAVLDTFTEIGEPATAATELAVWGSWASPDSALGIRGLSISVPFVVGSALIGAAVAIMARRGPISNSGYRIAAASGIAGPLIVTAAHLFAGPTQSDSTEAMAVILVGPYAAIAGLLGSLIVCAIPRSGGQLDDKADESASDRTETEAGTVYGSAGAESAWTSPEAPTSSYGKSRSGKTKEMPGRPDGDAPPDPDVDWVQELKPVGENGTGTVTAEPDTEPEAKPKKRIRKPTKRTRRKLSSEEPAADSDSDSDS